MYRARFTSKTNKVSLLSYEKVPDALTPVSRFCVGRAAGVYRPIIAAIFSASNKKAEIAPLKTIGSVFDGPGGSSHLVPKIILYRCEIIVVSTQNYSCGFTVRDRMPT